MAPHRVRAMVELHQNSRQSSSSVKAFKAADQKIGSLLDIRVQGASDKSHRKIDRRDILGQGAH